MKDLFTRLARQTAVFAGSVSAFITATLTVVIWFVVGPYFDWSDRHMLFINTLTTIVTFEMVFLIQHSGNHDTKSIHAKLDAILDGQKNNRFKGIERETEEKVDELKEAIQDHIDQ